MLRKLLVLLIGSVGFYANAASNHYCEALCAFHPQGYAESYILLQSQDVSPVGALNSLRATCTADYEGSMGYLYLNTPTGMPDQNFTQASIENSCKLLN